MSTLVAELPLEEELFDPLDPDTIVKVASTFEAVVRDHARIKGEISHWRHAAGELLAAEPGTDADFRARARLHKLVQ